MCGDLCSPAHHWKTIHKTIVELLMLPASAEMYYEGHNQQALMTQYSAPMQFFVNEQQELHQHPLLATMQEPTLLNGWFQAVNQQTWQQGVFLVHPPRPSIAAGSRTDTYAQNDIQDAQEHETHLLSIRRLANDIILPASKAIREHVQKFYLKKHEYDTLVSQIDREPHSVHIHDALSSKAVYLPINGEVHVFACVKNALSYFHCQCDIRTKFRVAVSGGAVRDFDSTMDANNIEKHGWKDYSAVPTAQQQVSTSLKSEQCINMDEVAEALVAPWDNRVSGKYYFNALEFRCCMNNLINKKDQVIIYGGSSSQAIVILDNTTTCIFSDMLQTISFYENQKKSLIDLKVAVTEGALYDFLRVRRLNLDPITTYMRPAKQSKQAGGTQIYQ